MNYLREVLPKGAPFSGIPDSKIADKFEVSNEYTDSFYTSDMDERATQLGTRLNPPIHRLINLGNCKYEKEVVEKFDDLHGEYVDDITTNPYEMHRQSARQHMEDFGPDAAFFESDQPRRDPNLARERLNLQYNSTRGNTSNLPKHEGLFIGFMEHEERNAANDIPLGERVREQSYAGKRMQNAIIRMGDSDETQQTEATRSGFEVHQDRKKIHLTMRNKTKVFDQQFLSMANKSNIAANPKLFRHVEDENKKEERDTFRVATKKTITNLGREMALQTEFDQDFSTTNTTNTKRNLAVPQDYVMMSMIETDQKQQQTFGTAVVNKKSKSVHEDVINIQSKTANDFKAGKSSTTANKKGKSLPDDPTAVNSSTVGDQQMKAGTEKFTSNDRKSRHFDSELNRVVHYTDTNHKYHDHVTGKTFKSADISESGDMGIIRAKTTGDQPKLIIGNAIAINGKQRDGTGDDLNIGKSGITEIKIDHKTLLENMTNTSMEIGKIDFSTVVTSTDIYIKRDEKFTNHASSTKKGGAVSDDPTTARYQSLEDTIRLVTPGGNGSVVNYKQLALTSHKAAATDGLNRVEQDFNESAFSQMRRRRERTEDQRQLFDREGVDYKENGQSITRSKRNGKQNNHRALAMSNDINSGETMFD